MRICLKNMLASSFADACFPTGISWSPAISECQLVWSPGNAAQNEEAKHL